MDTNNDFIAPVDAPMSDVQFARLIMFWNGYKAAAQYLRQNGYCLEAALSILLGK